MKLDVLYSFRDRYISRCFHFGALVLVFNDLQVVHNKNKSLIVKKTIDGTVVFFKRLFLYSNSQILPLKSFAVGYNR